MASTTAPPAARRRILGIGLTALALSAALAACSFPPTLAERFARERWEICQRRIPQAALDGIDPDGLIAYHYTVAAAAPDMDRCLADLAERQMLRVLAPMPPRAQALPPGP